MGKRAKFGCLALVALLAVFYLIGSRAKEDAPAADTPATTAQVPKKEKESIDLFSRIDLLCSALESEGLKTGKWHRPFDYMDYQCVSKPVEFSKSSLLGIGNNITYSVTGDAANRASFVEIFVNQFLKVNLADPGARQASIDRMKRAVNVLFASIQQPVPTGLLESIQKGRPFKGKQPYAEVSFASKKEGGMLTDHLRLSSSPTRSNEPTPRKRDIRVKILNIKPVDGKYRYFFDIRNHDTTPFVGIVTIQLFKGSSRMGEESFSTSKPMQPKLGNYVYLDIYSGPVSVMGQNGITAFRYKVKDENDAVISDGSGELITAKVGM